jgi:ADP-heptose:LPS heptosyltransferase
LLRRAIAGLKAAGHGVSLMAPGAPAQALLGPGTSAVDEVLDWEDPAWLPLFAEDDAMDPGLAARFEAFSACIAYTGQSHLIPKLEALVPRVIAHPPAPRGVHAAEWLARPALALGGEPPTVPPDLQATAAEESRAEAFLGLLPPAFLAVHPGSGAAGKNWPGERFARLATELGPEPWLLVEGPADGTSAAGLAEAGSFVRARHLPLRTLGAVLRRAALFVGNDSGVTHLAAAWGAPTLALFGPTDPKTWSPVGRLVAVARSPSASMDDLSPAEVSRAARALRAGGHGPEPPSLR